MGRVSRRLGRGAFAFVGIALALSASAQTWAVADWWTGQIGTITPASDGAGVLVLGAPWRPARNRWSITRLEPDGTLRWQREVVEPTTLYDIVATPAGSVASGLVEDPDRTHHGALIALDQSGAVRWALRTAAAGTFGDLEVMADGDVVVVGGLGSWPYSPFVTRIAPDGSVRWTRGADLVSSHELGLSPGPANSVLLSGTVDAAAGDRDAIVLELDASGDPRWAWHVGDPGVDEWGRAWRGPVGTVDLQMSRSLPNRMRHASTLARIGADAVPRWEAGVSGACIGALDHAATLADGSVVAAGSAPDRPGSGGAASFMTLAADGSLAGGHVVIGSGGYYALVRMPAGGFMTQRDWIIVHLDDAGSSDCAPTVPTTCVLDAPSTAVRVVSATLPPLTLDVAPWMPTMLALEPRLIPCTETTCVGLGEVSDVEAGAPPLTVSKAQPGVRVEKLRHATRYTAHFGRIGTTVDDGYELACLIDRWTDEGDGTITLPVDVPPGYWVLVEAIDGCGVAPAGFTSLGEPRETAFDFWFACR